MLNLIATSETLPVTLADMKVQLRIEHEEEDQYITDLIWAANDLIEKQLGRTFVAQTWDLILPRFCECHLSCRCQIKFPMPPLASVTTVKYYDPTDSFVTMSSGDYYVVATSEDRGFVQPVPNKYWPATSYYRANAVQIRFETDDAILHPTYVQLLKIWVTLLYENRTGEISKQEAATIDRLENLLRVYC